MFLFLFRSFPSARVECVNKLYLCRPSTIFRKDSHKVYKNKQNNTKVTHVNVWSRKLWLPSDLFIALMKRSRRLKTKIVFDDAHKREKKLKPGPRNKWLLFKTLNQKSVLKMMLRYKICLIMGFKSSCFQFIRELGVASFCCDTYT